MRSYRSLAKKWFMTRRCRTAFFLFQVEYQGQARYARILERKPLIDTSYSIQHRLEVKYFHFAQFFLNTHRAAH